MSALQSLRAQWQQSRVLQLGVLVVAVLLGGYALDVIDEEITTVQNDITQLQARHGRLQHLADDGAPWRERAETLRGLRVELESQLWRAPTPGLAQASVQSWLDRELRRANAEGLRLSVDDTRDEPGTLGLWSVPAAIEGRIEPALLYDVLRRIETSERLLVVESLQVQQRGRNRLLTLRLRAYVMPEQT